VSAAFGLRRPGVRFEYWGAALWRLLLFGALFVALSAVGAVVQQYVPGGKAQQLAPVTLLLASALIAGWVVLRLVDHRPFGAVGFAWTSQTPRELLVGFAIGGGGLALGGAALALSGLLYYQPDTGDALLYVAGLIGPLGMFGIAAAAEEALFRGYPFQVLVRALGPASATILASAVFAVAHHDNPGVGRLALLNIFLAGILLSCAYLRTRSLWFATAVHLGWNWTMATLFDLPVSGLRLVDTPLYDAVVQGPIWVTGGGFGPEGGVVATGAFVLMAVAVLRTPGLDEAPEMRRLRPLVDVDDLEEGNG
jgi:membrane protease YdiL (CAAX protease family)